MFKHIILTNGRSGSNYLSNLLNLHPHITNYGEVLGEWTVVYQIYNKLPIVNKNNYEAYLDYIYNSKTFFNLAQVYSAYSKVKKKNKPNWKSYQQIQTIGIKDFSINFKKRGIFDYLKKRDILVINLYRENLLKRLISLESLQKTNIVAITEKSESTKKIKKVYLPPEELISQLNLFAEEKKEQFEMIEALPQNRVLNIAYESYFANPESQTEINNKIFDFLEVEKIAVTGTQKKILPDKPIDIIENYEEVAKILQDTEYQQYLEEKTF